MTKNGIRDIRIISHSIVIKLFFYLQTQILIVKLQMYINRVISYLSGSIDICLTTCYIKI